MGTLTPPKIYRLRWGSWIRSSLINTQGPWAIPQLMGNNPETQ